MNLKISLLLPFLMLVGLAKAQTIDYQIKFTGIGDNREFFSNYNEPQTILGSRGNITLGAALDTVHSLRMGIDYFYEYGSSLGELPPEMILFYEAHKDAWRFRMGNFNRAEVIQYPLAIMADDYCYYNPNIEGLFIGYNKEKITMNLFADWVGRQDSARREQFMAGFVFQQRPTSVLLFDESWYMFHNAHTKARPVGEFIEDYMGALVTVGVDLSGKTPFDVATLKTGLLCSLWRNRGNGNDFEMGNSSFTELQLEKRGYGLRSSFNFGDAHHLFLGDSFYNNTTSYIRTDLYFTPINAKRVKGRFTWSFHVANGDLDNQQLFSLIYIFGENIKQY